MENLSPSRETPKRVDSDLNDWFRLKQIVPNNDKCDRTFTVLFVHHNYWPTTL